MGTSWAFSARRRAVTTTSSKPACPSAASVAAVSTAIATASADSAPREGDTQTSTAVHAVSVATTEVVLNINILPALLIFEASARYPASLERSNTVLPWRYGGFFIKEGA
jgi:hypothetical protein